MAVCLGTAIGCGARTDTLFDENSGGDSFGGSSSGGLAHGGGFPTAGTQGLGGANGVGGTFGFGGGFPTGGSHTGGFGTAGNIGLGGGFPAGGSGNFGGSAPTAGTSAFGGSVSTGGFGGFGAVGGEAGAGGTGGIVDLCVGAAQNACDKCLCQTCGSDLNACFTDIGCALIFACAQQQQCGLNCYQNATCRRVIDQFGGLTGSSFAEVFSLASCSVVTRKSCGCN